MARIDVPKGNLMRVTSRFSEVKSAVRVLFIIGEGTRMSLPVTLEGLTFLNSRTAAMMGNSHEL